MLWKAGFAQRHTGSAKFFSKFCAPVRKHVNCNTTSLQSQRYLIQQYCSTSSGITKFVVPRNLLVSRFLSTSCELRFNDYSYESRYSRRRRETFEDFHWDSAADTLVYTYHDRRFFLFISILAGVISVILIGHSYLTYTDGQFVPVTDIKTPVEERGTFKKFLSFCRRNQWTLLSIVFGFLGVCIAVVIPLFIRRSVKELWVINNGEKVRLILHDTLARQRQVVVDLEDISFQNSRSSKSDLILFKRKDVWFYYMMDKRKGKFMHPNVFDFVVCKSRKIF